MKVSDIKMNPRNPRRISGPQLEKLKESINRDPEFMRLRPIVVDEAGMVLGGNQRLKAIKALGMKEIPDDWVAKAKDLTPEQRERFVLVDNSIPGMSGVWDLEVLAADWELPELEELGFSPADLGIFEDDPVADIVPEIDDRYTREIKAPVYEIKGKKPAIQDLFDEEKTKSLLEEIESADIPEEVRGFLVHAAQRHTSFHFARIAEFYAHASPDIQRLMEDSALVIIDFDAAIEGGFVKLTDRLCDIAGIEDSE